MLTTATHVFLKEPNQPVDLSHSQARPVADFLVCRNTVKVLNADIKFARPYFVSRLADDTQPSRLLLDGSRWIVDEASFKLWNLVFGRLGPLGGEIHRIELVVVRSFPFPDIGVELELGVIVHVALRHVGRRVAVGRFGAGQPVQPGPGSGRHS